MFSSRCFISLQFVVEKRKKKNSQIRWESPVRDAGRLSPGVFTPVRRVSGADGATECGIMLSSHGGSVHGLSAGVRF